MWQNHLRMPTAFVSKPQHSPGKREGMPCSGFLLISKLAVELGPEAREGGSECPLEHKTGCIMPWDPWVPAHVPDSLESHPSADKAQHWQMSGVKGSVCFMANMPNPLCTGQAQPDHMGLHAKRRLREDMGALAVTSVGLPRSFLGRRCHPRNWPCDSKGHGNTGGHWENPQAVDTDTNWLPQQQGGTLGFPGQREEGERHTWTCSLSPSTLTKSHTRGCKSLKLLKEASGETGNHNGETQKRASSKQQSWADFWTPQKYSCKNTKYRHSESFIIDKKVPYVQPRCL